MSELPRFVAGYWGKAQPRGEGPEWHPLAYHSLEVAAVGEALLAVRPRLLETLAQVAELDVSSTRNLLLFVLVIHDLGKFGDDFQIKRPDLWTGATAFLVERGRSEPTRGRGHGTLGATIWQTLTAHRGARDLSCLVDLDPWSMASFAHHGRPVDTNHPVLSDVISRTAMADAEAFLRYASILFPPPAVAIGAAALARAAWIVAGLAILADWLGSNQRWFPYCEPCVPLTEYWATAQTNASRAVRGSGLAEASIADHFDLGDALGHNGASAEHDPTPLQRWAAKQSFISPALVILEDLTGSGKTEAALILAHRLMRGQQAEGVYWALPTMATADGLYPRLSSSYRSLFTGGEPSLVLAHSARDLNRAFLQSIAGRDVDQESYGVVEDALLGDAPASASCSAWIADDRRTAFLAQVGVGTIDQALLGILPVKHQSIRIAALARRVLVVDEAHAFAAYENRLLERLIEFQAAMGGSIIVLSATLPLERRQAYVKAYARGQRTPVASPDDLAFPLATTLTAGRVSGAAVESHRGTRRDLPVRRFDDELEVDAVICEQVADGGCVAWVRNTVRDAIEAAQRLSDISGREVMLFHARFALADRLRRQAEVLSAFGKDSRKRDRAGRILIATQVIEQSIDCDWDRLVSDLAPIDLLIQRAGRLQRHERGPRAPPVLHVLGPPAVEDPTADWYARAFPRGRHVYPDHGRLWLTQHTIDLFGGMPLRSRSPRDLIEAVYGAAAEALVPSGLQKRSGGARGLRQSHRTTANLNALDLAQGLTSAAGAWDVETQTPTRLADETRTVRLARWDGHRLHPWADDSDTRRAWRLSEITLRFAQVAGAVSPDPGCEAAVAAEVALWPERRFNPPLVLPLIEGGASWRGVTLTPGGTRLSVIYDRAHGLQFL